MGHILGDLPVNYNSRRLRILIIATSYLPGWRAGGPVRSLANITSALGGSFDFWIVTRDHDHLDPEPYPGIEADTWHEKDTTRIFYGTRRALSPARLPKLIARPRPDMVILTGLFSNLTVTYLAMRRLGRTAKVPTLILPQGQLGPGALSIRGLKKRVFLHAARFFGFVAGTDWQASSEEEMTNIKSRFPGAIVHVASDIPGAPPSQPLAHPAKAPGSVSLVFISRLSPMKNLSYVVDLLPELDGDVDLHVFGPDQEGEWPRIAEEATIRSPTKRISYEGAIEHQEVESALADAHFFAFPTLGENFGHVVYEALASATPVVISDATPWKGLRESGAGWDIALDRRDRWIEVLQKCIDMDNDRYLKMSSAAHNYARNWYDEGNHVARQADVYQRVLSGSGHT